MECLFQRHHDSCWSRQQERIKKTAPGPNYSQVQDEYSLLGVNCTLRCFIYKHVVLPLVMRSLCFKQCQLNRSQDLQNLWKHSPPVRRLTGTWQGDIHMVASGVLKCQKKNAPTLPPLPSDIPLMETSLFNRAGCQFFSQDSDGSIPGRSWNWHDGGKQGAIKITSVEGRKATPRRSCYRVHRRARQELFWGGNHWALISQTHQGDNNLGLNVNI